MILMPGPTVSESRPSVATGRILEAYSPLSRRNEPREDP